MADIILQTRGNRAGFCQKNHTDGRASGNRKVLRNLVLSRTHYLGV